MTDLPCNCGVSKGLRSDHEGECQAAYLRPRQRALAPQADPVDMEALAAIEHQSWSTWTRYMLEQIEKELKLEASTPGCPDPQVPGRCWNMLHLLPCVKRWTRQHNTPYADLSEKEKESDRGVVRKKLGAYRPPAPPVIPPHHLTVLERNKYRAWKVAERLAREEGLEIHSDASDYPVLVVPKTYHPVRPHDGPVPEQSEGRKGSSKIHGYVYVSRQKHEGGLKATLEGACAEPRMLDVLVQDLGIEDLERIVRDLKAIEVAGPPQGVAPAEGAHSFDPHVLRRKEPGPCDSCRYRSTPYGTCYACGRKWGVCQPKTIVVNGVEKKVHADELSYEEVVFMAGETGVVSMTYSRDARGRFGVLLPGQSVKIKDGTVFNACRTDNA